MERKTALITGASRGIGRAIALKYAKNGYNIAINYIGDVSLAEGVKKECEAFGVIANIYEADVSSYSACEQMVDKIIADFGKIDVLINNAGITKDTLLMRMDENMFQSVINVNLTSVFNMCKTVTKYMMKARSGRIVNISSIVGIFGNAGQCNYSASKAGIIGFTKSLAKEIGRRGITVNAVAPGFIETPMTAVLPEETKQKMLSTISLSRFGQPEDIANAIFFFTSDEASYITGQVLVVDGGMN